MCRPGARPAAVRTTRAQRLSPSAPSQPVQRRGYTPLRREEPGSAHRGRRSGKIFNHFSPNKIRLSMGRQEIFPQAWRDLRDGPDVRPGLPPGGRPRELRHGHARWRRELLRARQLRRLAADRGGGPRQRPRPARVQTGRQDGPRVVRRHQLGGIPYRCGGGGGGRGLRVRAAVRRRLLHRRRSQLDGGPPDVHRDPPDRRVVLARSGQDGNRTEVGCKEGGRSPGLGGREVHA